MLARIRKSMQERDQGFTLIELLVVIIIIGILAAIAIPVFLNQRNRGYDAAAKSDLKNMATAEETVLTDTSAYTDDLTALVGAGFKTSAGVTGHAATIDTAPDPAGSSAYCLKATSQSGQVWYVSSWASAPSNVVPDVDEAPAGVTIACP